MSTARLLIGDARRIIPTLDDGSIDCLITSPPYPWQRSYLPDGHPDKPLEVGQEATPGEALESLLDLMDLLWPKMADHATFWVNLGDAHSGSGGSGGDYREGHLREGQAKFQGTAKIARNTLTDGSRSHSPWKGAQAGWPLAQSVCWIPQLFGASLAYGRNLLTGTEHRQWITRPPIVWAKPNPTVGATGRKFRTATEYIVYGGKRTDHYFDLDAVRIPSDYDRPNLRGQGARAGRPPYNWWLIEPPAQYPGSHYAVMPDQLVVDPIKAGSPERVCAVCGKPSERIVDSAYSLPTNGGPTHRDRQGSGRVKPNGRLNGRDDPPETGWERVHETVGWTDFACPGDHWRPGLVCDPFCGTGTVGAVAVGHGRDALLIDLDGRNEELVRRRLGLFLEADAPPAKARRRTAVVEAAEGIL